MPGPTPRQLAREETLRRIKTLALGQLAEGGAGDLSLRAIARELNLVSSAIYRYFGSRDELITALIIDAFNDLAEVLELAGARDRRTPVRRWQDVCFAFRDWARDQPHRFGLIYGSSIPGYHAPRETVEPAVRGYRAFCLAGVDADPPFSDVGGRELRGQLATALQGLELAVSEQAMLALTGAFARIIGLITLDLGGHFVGSFEPADKLFEAVVHREAEILGITGQRRRTQRAESMP